VKYNPGKAPYAEERYLKEAHRLYGVLNKRLDGREYARMGYVYDPALGAIAVTAGETTKLDYAVPEKLPASLGKVPEASGK